MEGSRTDGSLTFDRSTIEGASITAGTHAQATLEGARVAFAARGGVREVDPQRLGAALHVPALADPRVAGRVDADFDVEGSGRTLKTLDARAHLVVPRATLAAGALRDVDVTSRVLKGALEATLTTSFANIDPAMAASKPELAGAVSGSLESQVSLPDLTRLALETTSGRATLTLEPSRVANQSIDRASLSASLAAGVLDVQQFDAAGPLGAAKASGRLALNQTDQSTLAYHVELADLAAAATLAGQKDIAGAVTLDGSVAGNRAELRTTGALSAANARYGTTVRVVDTDARYDVTLPDLDVNRVRADVKGKASLIEAAGRPIRELTLDARYAERQAAFETHVAETEERTLDAKGVVALPPGGAVDLRLERLAVSAPDISWSTTAPARVVYGGGRVDVEGLKLASGEQRLTIDGGVALGAELAGSTVSREQPLKISAENLDLAAVDRLAATGRDLAGRLNATATMAGSVDAPLVDATVGVRDGAFGEFKYQTLDATLHHDASSARVEARLDQGAAWVNLRGTLPTVPALRSESGGRSAPVDVTLETSPIELSVLQAFTTAVKDLKGVTQANVHVTGSVAAPIVDGRVQVTEGALTVVATETPFTGLNADVAMKGDRVAVARFEVADKDGHRLAATGGLNVSLADRSWRDVDVRLTGEDFKVLDGDLGKLSVDVDLALRGAPTGLRAEGKVAVHDGRIEIDRVLEQFRPAAPPAPAPVGDSVAAPRVTVTGADGAQVVSSVAAIPDGSRAKQERRAAPGAPGVAAGSVARAASTSVSPAVEPTPSPTPSITDHLAFDVRVTVPNNLVVRGDNVRVGGEGMSLGDLNMTLGGELRATRRSGGRAFVVGSVRTVRGFYEFQGRRFDLVRDGSVSFKGPDATNPQVDVSATRDIAGVEARVRVHGEAQRPELELSSAPPLDEADILSLIIFNRPINDLGEGEKTSLAQQAGSLVGGFVASPVAEALRDALDVDLLEITPVTDSGAPSVSIGNQIGERVFVKVRQQFGSSENTQLVLEYELSKLLRLETNVSQGGDTSRTVGQRAERGGADLVFVIKY
jgi:autotransporter translocation and assembly factor TamB